MSANLDIKGLDELLSKIDSLAGMYAIKTGLKAAGMHVKGKIAEYPSESEANMPRTVAGTGTVLPWYERGFGTRYIGGGGRQTSETLGRKWTRKFIMGGLGILIGNNVSYGDYVQGIRQVGFHAARGWKTTDQVAEEETNTVIKFLKDHIDRELKK